MDDCLPQRYVDQSLLMHVSVRSVRTARTICHLKDVLLSQENQSNERLAMKMKSRRLVVVCAAVALSVLLASTRNQSSSQAGEPSGAAALLKDVQSGNPGFKRIGRMSFGPDGLLLVADPGSASVVAINTGDVGPVVKLKRRIDKVDDLIAASMGAKPGSVGVVDMTVNPKSGKIYLSVQNGSQYAILVITADAKISNLNLDKARYVRITLPGDGKASVSNITDVKFANDRVLAAGQSGNQFSSKIYSLPVPLTHGATANIFSAETYHVAHGKWETRAPIQSFVPYEEDGKNYVVGSFACTPIAKFPLDDLKSGAKVKGISVVELGSGNRPLDMFTYKKDGKQWLITNTDRFHHKRRPFGPSQYWGARIDMKYLASEKINEKAVRRVVGKDTGPEGIEVVKSLFFVKQVDKLNDKEMVLLKDNKGKLDLEVAPLP